MSKAIKFLVSGYESSGKSTLTSKVKDALVINFDKKEYDFPIPHANFKEYKGVDSVINFINEKISAYKEAKGEFPKVLILDTITQLYTAMVSYNASKYTGYSIHSQNNIDTLDLNDYIENILIPNGVSVIIVAHTLADSDTGRHYIHAQGQFSKSGSWLSVVNEAIFIEKLSNKLIIYFKSFKYPARTTMADLPEKIEIEKYDINEHIAKLTSNKDEASKYEI